MICTRRRSSRVTLIGSPILQEKKNALQHFFPSIPHPRRRRLEFVKTLSKSCVHSRWLRRPLFDLASSLFLSTCPRSENLRHFVTLTAIISRGSMFHPHHSERWRTLPSTSAWCFHMRHLSMHVSSQDVSIWSRTSCCFLDQKFLNRFATCSFFRWG